jgi:hypothetical protein
MTDPEKIRSLRSNLLLALLESEVVGNFSIDKLVPGRVALVVSSYDKIKPNEQSFPNQETLLPNQQSIVVRNSISFMVERLVILETEHEFVEKARTEILESAAIETSVTTGMCWWKKTEIVSAPPVYRRVYTETRTTKTVSRSAWNIHSMYAGATNVLYSASGQNGISGSSFGTDDQSPLRHVEMPAGHDLTITVSHNLADAVPFRALLIGQEIKLEEPSEVPQPINKVGKKRK